jgi:hemerythrin-like domain-containing protein
MTPFMTLFRKQHADIVEMVKQIEPHLDAEKLAVSATEARHLLAILFGKLSVHLAMEDNSLYPSLEKHQVPRVRDTARKFREEMSGVKPAVEAFSRKWQVFDIRANPTGFCTETKHLFAVLADRIKRENTELYPLAEERVAAPASTTSYGQGVRPDGAKSMSPATGIAGQLGKGAPRLATASTPLARDARK